MFQVTESTEVEIMLDRPVVFATIPVLSGNDLEASMLTHGKTLVLALLGLALLAGGCGGGGGSGVTLPSTSPTPSPSDKPTLTITAPEAFATENDTAPDSGVIRIARTGATTAALTVSVVVQGTLSNVPGEDFEQAPLGDTIVIPAGSDHVNLTITPMDDSEVEGAELLIVRLVPNVAEYRLGTVIEATIQVHDDDAITLSINVAVARARIDAESGNPLFQIIDVRTSAEYAGGHLEGAINIDLRAADFDARIAALDPAGTYLVYCMAGSRSASARDRMEQDNLREILNMLGGINAWTTVGYPVVTD